MHDRDPYAYSAGFRPHKVRQQKPTVVGDPKPDAVPVSERYSDLATHIHKCAVVPRGDRFLMGCTCGWYAVTAPGAASTRASLQCQDHVLREAENMQAMLEPKPIEEQTA